MFGNRRKTIGVFINRLEMEFQKMLIKGLVSEALEYDFNLAFMDSYGIRESENMYDYYESAIINFAPIEKFDAIIVALDTYDTPMLREKLLEALQHRAKCPVISFREENEIFYSVTSVANELVEELVQHLVEKHGVKRLGFMAGYLGHVDSKLRYEGFCKKVESYGLKLEENAIFYADMWKLKGEEAYTYFFEGDGIRPEGIICANDYMARALCDAVLRHGLRIPQDVCICGFDNVKESYHRSPELTTVAVDYERMAKEAIRLVDSILKGKNKERNIHIPAQLFLRESCCKNGVRKITKGSSEEIQKLDEFMEKHNRQMYFSVDMDGCANYEEMFQIIEKNITLLGDYKDFYLCFFDKRDQDGVFVFDSEISEYALLEMAFQDGKKLNNINNRFEQKKLLPVELITEQPFIGHFTLLHNRNKCFGYTVVSYRNPAEELDVFFHNWNLTLSLTINDLSIRNKIIHLSNKNEALSITDYMTGIFNRRGFEQIIFNKWKMWVKKKEHISFISIDLDNLKYINDTYGHKDGDKAICEVAQAISVFLKNGIAARMGGDEFAVVIENADKNETQRFIENINHRLDVVNRNNEKYKISVSVGCYDTNLDESDDYEECIKKSDMIMYQMKKSRSKY